MPPLCLLMLLSCVLPFHFPVPCRSPSPRLHSANYVIQEYLLSEAAAAGGGGGQYKPLPSDEGAVSDGVSPPSPRAGRAAPHPPLELPPPSGQDLSLYTGGTCLVVFSVYVLVHTVPHWGDWVTASIARQHGVTAVIGGQYAALTAASYAHAVAHYDLVATVGAGTLVGPASELRGGGGKVAFGGERGLGGRREWGERGGEQKASECWMEAGPPPVGDGADGGRAGWCSGGCGTVKSLGG